jgi:predicted ester cyclase
MTVTTGSALVDQWLHLWNGDEDVAPALLADDFRFHAAVVTTDAGVQGPDGLLTWIRQARAAMSDLEFAVEVGPVVQDDMIALRWRGTGHYSGGFPGATAAPGTPVDFTGADFLRLDHGRVAEYWATSDMHVLFAQLGVGGPAD